MWHWITRGHLKAPTIIGQEPVYYFDIPGDDCTKCDGSLSPFLSGLIVVLILVGMMVLATIVTGGVS